MNHRVVLPLLICILMLAGCYRQSTDSFEQVDSQSVESIASPTTAIIQATIIRTAVDDAGAQDTNGTPTVSSDVQPSKTLDPSDVDPTDILLITPTLGIPPTNVAPIVPTATDPVFLTPEPAPGQIEQPTVIPPTATATFDVAQPTPTDVSDGVQAGDECIHEVAAGDTLFRISINNGTTVEAVQQLNSLEGDAIQIGDLLRIPGCVPGQSDDDSENTVTQPTATSSVGGSTVATIEPPSNLPTDGQQIHVVVSGETLGGIANRYGTSISAIVELNNLTDPDALAIGDELLIPASN